MKKIIISLCLFFILASLSINSYAKYMIEDIKIVANINIDGEIPKIEFINIENTNKKYNKYANRTHTITIEIRIKEKNIKEDNTKKNLKFLLDNTEFRPRTWKTSKRTSGEYIYYTIYLYEISGNGKLKLKIPEGSVVDMANQVNEETVFDTEILIDNIAPVVNYSQDKIEDGKVLAKMKVNEKIREVNAWNLSEEDTVLTKEFACNVLYPFNVTDLAGNITNVDVRIDKATNIELKYGSISESPMNSVQYGTGLNEIVGSNAIKVNSKYKIEAMTLWWKGLEQDFIQTNCYINTYWGEGKQGRCYTYETRYSYGYNPGENQYATISNGTKINLEGKITLLLGGTGMNREGNRGIGGKAIPEEIAKQHLFGISSLNIKLKNESEYSIIYQAWVEGEGWLEPVSDGKETTFAHDKPIGAYRMSLIPKTEKHYLIDSWKKDVGTNNMK